MYRLLRPLLFRLDPETAHHRAIRTLRFVSAHPALAARLRRHLAVEDPRLVTRVFGLAFPSPLGLAAGFDKGDGVASGVFALGFGSVEVGTITPRPQPGNDRPRLFRLPSHRALVNRMGFNNEGAAEAARRYARLAFKPGPLGVNLGKNRATPPERAAEDYVAALDALWDVGDYFVVNVSSPNTPGLRDLQAPEALAAILRPVLARAAERGGKPVLVKLAPDLADGDVDAIAARCRSEGAAGLVLANTTLSRPPGADPAVAREAGGLSGAPLLPRTIALVSRVHRAHGPALPIIGVGGVSTGEDAYALVRAGASLVQAYTGFIYGGPRFARRVLRSLLRLLERDAFRDVSAAVGADGRGRAPPAEPR